MIDPNLFFQLLKGHCHGNQFYGKILVYAFTQHSGVPKEILILPFRFSYIQ